MPTGIFARIGIGIAFASVVALVLWLVLDRIEDRNDLAFAAERDDATAVPSRVEVPLPAAVPRGRIETLTLARRVSDLPRSLAPVVEIRRGGSVRLHRGAPAPSGPVAASRWDAAVALPATRLDELSPRERAAFLEILRVWGEGAEIGVGSLRAAGIEVATDAWEELTRWRR